MKYFKIFAGFLFFIVLVTLGLSFMLPTSQRVERSVVINAPVDSIYSRLARLATFTKFSVWSQQDSSAVYTFSGTDGTVGATSSWKGNPLISGEGKIEIITLAPNREVKHSIEFTQPKKGKATSTFLFSQVNRQATTVTWVFSKATPRPWNIYNLLYSLDKQMGKDFEEGLSSLKRMIESPASLSIKNN